MEETLIKRILPSNVEAEQSVIGAMLIDPEAIVVATDMLTGEDFYQRQCKALFEAIAGLYAEGKPVDAVTLQERLKEREIPEEYSSLEYIGNLIAGVPTSLNVSSYAQIVQEKALLRRLIKVCDEISNACYAGKDRVDDILEMTEKQIFQVLQRPGVKDFTPIKEIVMAALDRIESASRNRGAVTGMASGFIDLDYKTSGFQASDLILIAARPSMGKTALALNMAEYMAFQRGQTVAMFSLEMSREQLVNRLFSQEARIDAQLLRTGNLSDPDWGSLIEAAGVIGRSNLIIDDTPGISIPELRSKCRKYKLEYNVDIVMIDYLQLMQSGHRSESRQQEISEISRSLKEIARELQIPVIALSQLSRAVEQRPDHRPMLSDLRESGAIEQDADVVMFLYREDYYNKDTERKDVAEVIIAKQRNGPIGTIELAWLPRFTKFANIQK